VSEELRGHKVFVTGADGFIGSHLAEALHQAGAMVRALVQYNSWGSIGWLADLPANVRADIEVVFGDVRDPELIAKAVDGSSFVFHLASLIGIPFSYQAPRSYLDTNVGGTLNVLDACRRSTSLIRLIHTSTSEVYGTAKRVPIAEDHPLVGQSPYAATKIAADKLAESYHLSFGLPVVTARPFNTFGPRQTARAVIPSIISQLLSGADDLKLGALTPTRDFNYVTDTAAGFLALAACKAAEGAVVNIGTGEEWSIEATARMLMEQTGRQVAISCEEARVRPSGSEVARLRADAAKMRSLTGWRPMVPFADGLARTIAWIRRHPHYFEPKQYSR
jgi:NAD dependent epimerase/dehydratase